MRPCLRSIPALLALAAAPLLAQTASIPDGVPPAAQKLYTDALRYEQDQQLPGALDSLHAAMKASGNHCLPCLDELARVQMKLEDFKSAAATSAQVAKEATNPSVRAAAEYREGVALYTLYFAQLEGRGGIEKSSGKAASSLKQAESVLAQAEAADPANEPLRMLHGRVLASLKQNEAASREFTACASAPGASEQECSRAKRFASDVGLARNEPAPNFRATTLDGKPVSLDALAGKIVLIDFWATWCKWCEKDSAYVQSTLDSFDKDKDRYVLLEVSVDESDATWRNYVTGNRLRGIQTRDTTGDIAGLFHVGGYPTYIVLDGDGSIRYRISGAQGDLKAQVRKLLAEQSDAPATNLDRKAISGN